MGEKKWKISKDSMSFCWKVVDDNGYVCNVTTKENAQRIVTCVNSHDELMGACENIRSRVNHVLENDKISMTVGHILLLVDIEEKLQQALKAGRGKK